MTRLIRRQRRAGASNSKLKNFLKDEIRFQKFVINKKEALKLAGTLEQLKQSLELHLPVHEAPLPAEVHAAARPLAADELQEQGANRLREQEPEQFNLMTDVDPAETEREEPTDTRFKFSTQGQWVAVFYNEDFYIGQVIDIKDSETATVQYLEKAGGRKDFFRWPRCC